MAMYLTHLEEIKIHQETKEQAHFAEMDVNRIHAIRIAQLRRGQDTNAVSQICSEAEWHLRQIAEAEATIRTTPFLGTKRESAESVKNARLTIQRLRQRAEEL